MPNDKNYSKIDTEFTSFEFAKAPTPATTDGGQHNPGVCKALNTPPTEGNVKTTWYYDSPKTPSIVGQSPSQRIDTEFEQANQQVIGPYAWHPGDDGRSHGRDTVESTMNNPLGQSWGAPKPMPMPPTPPGAPNGFGGGQSANEGTPVGPELEYGGGQNVGGGATPSGPKMNYGGGQ